MGAKDLGFRVNRAGEINFTAPPMPKSQIPNPQSHICVGGLVLCGGQSTSMGLAKATPPLGAALMPQRAARPPWQAVSPIAVVAAPQQEWPPLPAEVIIA